MSGLREQSPGFLSAGELRPFSTTPGPGAPVPLEEPHSIWRTSSWFRSTWKSADTFLPSRTSSRDSDTKNGSIWGADWARWVDGHMAGLRCARKLFSRCLHWWRGQSRSRWYSLAALASVSGKWSWTFCPASPQRDAQTCCRPTARLVGFVEPAAKNCSRNKSAFENHVRQKEGSETTVKKNYLDCKLEMWDLSRQLENLRHA